MTFMIGTSISTFYWNDAWPKNPSASAEVSALYYNSSIGS